MLYTTLALLRSRIDVSGSRNYAKTCYYLKEYGLFPFKESTVDCLSKSLGKRWSEETPIPLSRILELIGLERAVLMMPCTTTDSTLQVGRMSIYFERELLPIFEKDYPEDNRPRVALQAAEDYLDKKISRIELLKAAMAARHAGNMLAWENRNASRSAERAYRAAMTSICKKTTWRVAHSAVINATEVGEPALLNQRNIFLRLIDDPDFEVK